ncbi:MAG: N-acetylgalactosamine 6-sulfate sulfatase, partial [Phycisphaerae bacterium]
GRDAGKVTRQYPLDSFPGHAAWLEWPWKLHRREGKGKVQFELYNLAEDAMEAKDLASDQPDRVKAMSAALAVWLKSVVRSLNGEDYR